MKLSTPLNSLFPYLLAIAGGVVLPLSLAPFNYEMAAFLAPALLLFCLAKASPKKSFLLGACFGWGMFGFGFSWIYVSIHDYGPTSMPLAVLMTSLFTFFIALFPALMSYTVVKLFPNNNFQRCVIAFPVIWVLFEIFRGWAFTGLPWLYIGYSQLTTHFSALAPIGGIWLVSWATVLTAGLIYSVFDYIYENKRNALLRNTLVIMLIILWGLASYVHKTFTWTQRKGPPLHVSLVQGNIPQLLRWDPNEVSKTIKKYQDLTSLDLGSNVKPDLIIWPESAIPIPIPESQPLLAQMDASLKQHHATLITGVPVQTHNDQGSIAYYNALVSIGEGSGYYFKQQLLPFGDYVPFEKWLRGIINFFDLPMSSFISAKENTLPLLAKNIKIAPAICYEIAYPNLVRQAVHSGPTYTLADLIITVSNDTWFGTSIGPNQHLEIAQFRALETGRYVLRATNTGLTAVITPTGAIQSIAPQFETTVLKDIVWAMEGQTPWVKYGTWPLLAGFGVLLIFAFIPIKQKK